MFKKNFFILSLLVLSILTGYSQEKKYYFVTNFDSIMSGHGVVVDKAGNLWYGSNTDSVGIRVVRQNGIPLPFSPIYDLSIDGKTYSVAKDNRGINLDPDGNIIVVIGATIIRINYQDGTGLKAKKFSYSSLAKPAIDAAGRLYTAPVNASGPIYILNSNFDSIGVVDKVSPYWSRAFEITPDGKDLYMGSLWDHVLVHYHSDDLKTYTRKENLSGPIEGDTPALNFDKDGRLWVAEFQSGRVLDKYFIYDLKTNKRDSLMGFGEKQDVL